jgi:hypothetical protein
MTAIILEGVLFVAFLVTATALLYHVLVSFTPAGVWLRQTRNRRQIERAALRRCSLHGPHREDELVRLPDGDRICPECYREVVHGEFNDERQDRSL